MHRDRDKWLGRDGVALADSAWSPGSELLMCPYTVADGSTAAQQWYNFVHSSTRFFVEETFGRWKNRFRCLLKRMEFMNKYCQQIILATAVLHNICTIFNDLEEDDFDGSDGDALGFPPSPLEVYNSLYPLDKIICPRCKKKSNGAMPSSGQPLTCDCNVRAYIDRALPRLFAQHPALRYQLKSSDPILRREAHSSLFYHFKPRDF